MDRTRATKRPPFNKQNNAAQDPRGEEKEEQPKTSRRTVETEMDRQEWRKFVAALHTPRGVKDDDNDMPHYTSIRLLKTILFMIPLVNKFLIYLLNV